MIEELQAQIEALKSRVDALEAAERVRIAGTNAMHSLASTPLTMSEREVSSRAVRAAFDVILSAIPEEQRRNVLASMVVEEKTPADALSKMIDLTAEGMREPLVTMRDAAAERGLTWAEIGLA